MNTCRRPITAGGRPFRWTKERSRRKGGRFAERDIDIPRQRTIEERVLAQVSRPEGGEFKQIRLVEGATVRESAEALGITPRDIVQLLIKRGVFATLNQPIGEKMGEELGLDFGVEVKFVPFEEMVVEEEFESIIETGGDDVEVQRAPVVTVMGHLTTVRRHCSMRSVLRMWPKARPEASRSTSVRTASMAESRRSGASASGCVPRYTGSRGIHHDACPRSQGDRYRYPCCRR